MESRWKTLLLLGVAVSALTWLEMGVSQSHLPYWSRMLQLPPRSEGDLPTACAYLLLGMANAAFVYDRYAREKAATRGGGWEETY